MVEPRGVEPLSESNLEGTSPGADCYLHSLIPEGTTTLRGGFCYFGGAEGNRTPVRRQLDKTFSGRSLLFTFPLSRGNKHSQDISSFMMRGMGKAYHTHVLYSDHTRARLVDLPGRMGA